LFAVIQECLDQYPDPQDQYGLCYPECESSLDEAVGVYERLCGYPLSDDMEEYVEDCLFPTVPQVPCTSSSTTDDSDDFTTDDSTDDWTDDSTDDSFDWDDDSDDFTTDDSTDDSFDSVTDDDPVDTTTDDSVGTTTDDSVDPATETESVGNGVKVRAGGSVGAMVAATVVAVLLSI